MLRFFIQVLLGPVKLPKHHAQQHGETRPCNVVGGCGTGCLCAPEQSENRSRTPAPGPEGHTPPEKGAVWPSHQENTIRRTKALAWEG